MRWARLQEVQLERVALKDNRVTYLFSLQASVSRAYLRLEAGKGMCFPFRSKQDTNWLT